MGSMAWLVSRIKSQRGSVMVMGLFIFLVISILTTMVIRIAIIENKMAIYGLYQEQARKLADAGVQVAKNVIMNYMANGRLIKETDKNSDIGYINDQLEELEEKNISVKISNFDIYSGIITIQSTGTVKNPGGSDVKAKVQAEIFVSTIPNYALRSNRLQLMGKYFATVSSEETKNLMGDLLNVQDWEPQDWDTVYDADNNPSSLPLHGRSYDDNEFTDCCRDKFQASNPNNPNPANYTWWVKYEYLNGTETDHKDSHDISKSKLYVAPFWKPYGIFNVISKDGLDAEMAVHDDWDNEPSGFRSIFDDKLTNPKVESNYPLQILKEKVLEDKREGIENRIYLPPENLKITDFIRKGNRVETKPNIIFNEEQVSRCGQLVQNHPDWQYITADSNLLQATGTNSYKLIIDDPNLIKTRFFIDLDTDDTVELDFTTVAHYNGPITSIDLFNDFINDMLNQTGTFFNRFRNNLESIIVVSPASLYVGIDSLMLAGVNRDNSSYQPYICLLSSRDINLLIDPKIFNGITRTWPNKDTVGEIRAFILAGNNVEVRSTPEIMTFKGIISASNNMTFFMDYFDEDENMFPLREVEKKIYVIKDPEIVSAFPEPWAYLGIGPIISYKYLD